MSARHDGPVPVELLGTTQALATLAATPTPEPEAAFLAGLEARLRSVHAAGTDRHPERPVAKRLLPVGGATLVASALTVVGAAAAGIVATRTFVDRSDRPDRPDRTEHSVPAPTTTSAGVAPSAHTVATSTTITVAPITTAASSSTEAIDATTATTEPAATTTAPPATSTTPAVLPATTASTAAPPAAQPADGSGTGTGTTTVTPAGSEPSTVESTTTAPPPTTEHHVPQTMTMTCTLDGTTVTCSFSGAAGDGYARSLLLRGKQGDATGSVLVDTADTSATYVDAGLTPGTYMYTAVQLDASAHNIGHSNSFTFTVPG